MNANDIEDILSFGDECYAKGEYQKALDSYSSAALEGSGEAAFRVGDMYIDGIGVRPDTKMARDWYIAAARKGCKAAEEKLKAIRAGKLVAKAVDVEKPIIIGPDDIIPYDPESTKRKKEDKIRNVLIAMLVVCICVIIVQFIVYHKEQPAPNNTIPNEPQTEKPSQREEPKPEEPKPVDQQTDNQQTGGKKNENQQTGGKQNGAKKAEDPKTVLAYLQKQEFDMAMAATNRETDKLAIAVLKKNVGRFSKDFYSQRISKWKDWAVVIAQNYLIADINAKIALGYEGVLSDNPGAVYSNIVGRFKEELALLNAKGLNATWHLRKMFPKDRPKKRDLDVYARKLADDKKVTWNEFVKF